MQGRLGSTPVEALVGLTPAACLEWLSSEVEPHCMVGSLDTGLPPPAHPVCSVERFLPKAGRALLTPLDTCYPGIRVCMCCGSQGGAAGAGPCLVSDCHKSPWTRDRNTDPYEFPVPSASAASPAVRAPVGEGRCCCFGRGFFSLSPREEERGSESLSRLTKARACGFRPGGPHGVCACGHSSPRWPE